MGARRGATVLALVGLLLTIAQVVWTVAFLNASGDGPAFAASLLGLIATPTCVAAGAVLLVRGVAPRTVALTGLFIAVTGVAAGAIEAAVFVADDPQDPAWIDRFANADPIAAFLAVLLAAALAWSLLPIRSTIARFFAAVPLAAIGTALTAILLLQTTAVWILAVALVVVLVVLTIRGRRRRPAVPAR